MLRPKNRTLTRLIFILLAIILFNAVYFTALIIYLEHHPELHIRFVSILFNVSLIPTITLMMPICTVRTLYQEKAFIISARAVTIGMLSFITLMWIADIGEYGFWDSVAFYFWWLAVSSIFTAIFRFSLKIFRTRGGDPDNVLIIGDGETGIALCNELHVNKQYGYKVIGYLGDESHRRRMNARWLGTERDLKEVVENNNVNSIYYITDNDRSQRINEIIEIANNNFINTYFVPPLGRHSLRRFSKVDSSLGVITLSFKGNRLQNPMNRALKRVFDLVFSSVAIIVLAVPVFLPIAIAVKLSSPGPVFFRQKRNGYHGKVFNCLKFRSMVVNDSSDSAATARNDKRITKVGRFLRKTSLDEIPQFFNVFVGDMSVVGPRPHILKQTEDYKALLQNYMVRHQIKPGITGWAQINNLRGTAETLDMMEKRVRADIWYIDNWSIILDIKITLRTAYNIFFTHEDGAY